MPRSEGSQAPVTRLLSPNRGARPLLLAILALGASLFQPSHCTGMESVDLLDSLHLHNTTFAGLQQKPGPHSHNPAVLFSGSNRAVYYSQDARDRVAALIQSSKEFTFLTSIRQQRLNSGTIFAFSYGKYQTNRYLEVQSSGRQDMLRVHYSPLTHNPWIPGSQEQPDNQVVVESFPLRLADDSWHRLAIIVSGDQIEVLLDCRSVHRRVVAPMDTSFSLPRELVRREGNLTLWLGQRNQGNFMFKGYLQEPRLVAGHHGFLKQCPTTDSSCPTCGQFRSLEETVNMMQRHILQLTARLEQAETKLEVLESCECSVGCTVEGLGSKTHGQTWEADCQSCHCQGGEVTCSPISCPSATCAKPDAPAPGECCHTCQASCEPLDDLTPRMTHGETFVPKRCTLCECKDGSVECITMSVDLDCPALNCSKEEQILEEGSCCPICREYDFCSRGHNCHKQSNCRNGIFNYSCHCNQGFQGNGTNCDDVDECGQSGGENGHHCPREHSRCLNLEGSYSCLCDSGFSMDPTNTTCLPKDPCSPEEHDCHQEAVCSALQHGSHSCTCNHGYIGDGHSCTPECVVPCQNGGSCTSPDQCSCGPGFTGEHCQEDVNECGLEESLRQCGSDSVCVNRPGWFYCACRTGFTSYRNPLTLLTTCTDVDECEEGSHTCHLSASCVNTLGSYTCSCSSQDCSTSCVLETSEHEDGSLWRDGCNTCTCQMGRATCERVACDCSVPGSDRGCCPECEDQRTCRHQDISSITYAAGQRWAYRCMECECLHGEVDCWPQDCPPTPCTSPAHLPGSCCPSCPGTPLPCTLGNSSCGVQAGLLRMEGDSWHLPGTACTSCGCKGQKCYAESSAKTLRAGPALFFALLSLPALLAWVVRPGTLPSSSLSRNRTQPSPSWRGSRSLKADTTCLEQMKSIRKPWRTMNVEGIGGGGSGRPGRTRHSLLALSLCKSTFPQPQTGSCRT